MTSQGENKDRTEQRDLSAVIEQMDCAEEDGSVQGAVGGSADGKKAPTRKEKRKKIKEKEETAVQREAGRKREEEESLAFARGSKIARTPTKEEKRGKGVKTKETGQQFDRSEKETFGKYDEEWLRELFNSQESDEKSYERAMERQGDKIEEELSSPEEVVGENNKKELNRDCRMPI